MSCEIKLWPPVVHTQADAAPVTKQMFEYGCGLSGQMIWLSPEQSPVEIAHSCAVPPIWSDPTAIKARALQRAELAQSGLLAPAGRDYGSGLTYADAECVDFDAPAFPPPGLRLCVWCGSGTRGLFLVEADGATVHPGCFLEATSEGRLGLEAVP